ncbi:MAG TPA: tripartite tricarboxylate transporter substrate binding protein [Xanthobacteraceae bacterium]|jgi:tripartite-type tricarboxylate transporter receptor subunit TctC|nr:tripartite tricarboxylate transporter substrate binding protein [Xanthobacteraceae bacterium]
MTAGRLALSRRALLAAGLPAIAIGAARAQNGIENYPERQVSFIVPFAPAGGTDILTRLLAQKLEQRFGKSFVVENRPGAGTILATSYLAKSPPDGYTIMMAVSSLAADVTLYKSLPYDPAKDFALVALIARVPFVLVVNPSLPVNSVEDLIKLAKQRRLGYGSGGVGAFHHLAGALFSSMTGIKMTHVPYRGTAPALNDLMAGYIQVMFTDYGPAAALISSGKLRALAVTTKKPFAVLPEVPPLAEAGVPGFDAAAWQGVIALSQTPPVIVAKLNGELNAAVAMNDVRARMRDIGMLPVGTGSPEELAQFFQSEIVRWGKVVQDAGIARSE